MKSIKDLCKNQSDLCMVYIESTYEIIQLSPDEYVLDILYGFKQLDPWWICPLKL